MLILVDSHNAVVSKERFDAGDAVTAPLSRLSPTLLAGHLSCAHLTQLERKRQAGEIKIEFNADPRLEAMRIRGQQHEARYVERLSKASPSVPVPKAKPRSQRRK